VPDLQPTVALFPAMGGIVRELKTPLDERALDRLTLATAAAVVAFHEQRLEIQAALMVRNDNEQAELAQTRTNPSDEIG
jgi:hypothetical protein